MERLEFVLGPEEVVVWLGRVSAGLEAECQQVLSEDERGRAERIVVEWARAEFVVGRGMLRRILGGSLGCGAEAVRFGVGRKGKPFVDGGVEFNVSHSKGMVAIAVCRSAVVGVDVEGVDEGIEALEIARGQFAAGEITRIERERESGRARAFYEIWTRKEALMKAHGDGLGLGLSGFEVGIGREGEEAVRVSPGGVMEATYFVRGLEVGEGYAGALAVSDPGREARLVHFGRGGGSSGAGSGMREDLDG